MSRVANPAFKFARSISSSANAARPSSLLDSQARASRYLPRNLKSLKAECVKRGLSKTGNKSDLADRLSAHDIVGSQTTQAFHSSPRPTTLRVPTIYKTGHLMQGFQTSAPRQASRDASTIDFFFFPDVPEPAPANPYKIRVPLLPDNYNPDRSPSSPHAVETLDSALPKAEISIVASHPEDVVPATMTEVVGNDGLEVAIETLTKGFNKVAEELPEPSTLKALWEGFLDDIFGPKAGAKQA